MIEDIESALSNFSDVEFVGGVSEETVQNAENALGVRFSSQYRQFLLRFGAGAVDSEEFVGLGGPRHLDVVWLTNDLRNCRRPFANWLIPLRADGYGNYDCLDTATQLESGENPVVEWVHDYEEKPQPYRQLGDSFEDWFMSMLRDIRELNEEEKRRENTEDE